MKNVTHVFRQRGRRLLAVLASALAVVAGLSVPATATGAALGVTPGTYSDYSFGSSGISNFTSVFRVTDDPGRSANSFWATQFGFVGTEGAYVGMQANGNNQERTLIFSAWDTTEAEALSPGAYCTTFTGEGVGRTCRMRFAWVEDRDYALTIDLARDGWATFTFADVAAGKTYPIGRIKTRATQIHPNMVNWVEYFEWNSSLANCNNQPFSSVLFSLPTTRQDGRTVTSTLTHTDVTANACASTAKVERVGNQVRHSLAIGNSIRGRIQSNDGTIVTAPVSGTARAVQPSTKFSLLGFWNDQYRTDYPLCMEYRGGSTIAMTQCNSTNDTTQAWQQIPMVNGGFYVRNAGSNMCLDHENGDPARVKLVARTCGTGETNSQRWYLRAGNQLGVALTCVTRVADGTLADAACNPNSFDQRWHVFEGDSTRSNWVYDKLGMIRINADQCLTDYDWTVQIRSCDDSNPAQRWIHDPVAQTIRANHGGHACLARTGQVVELLNCTGADTQRWTMATRS